MSLLPPTGLPVDVSLRPRSLLKYVFSRIRGYSRVQPPPEGSHAEKVLYGFAQPILGARILLADPTLLQEALYPGAILAIVCAIYASISGSGSGSHEIGHWLWFKQFYKAFAYLAPLPSVVFANHYARIAAMIRWRLGFGACGPREMPLGMLLMRLARQAAIVAIGAAPFIWVVNEFVPILGPLIAGAAATVWGLHWVVADAFDDAQVCLPGESLQQSIDRDRRAPSPWFIRWINTGADHLTVFSRKVPIAGGLMRVVSGLMKRFARFCDKLALDSRGEIEIMEKNRFVSLGFGLSTAALLAVPVVNLLFRPIVLAAASHVVGQVEAAEEHHGAIENHGTPSLPG
jgi:hypothetical protein